MKSSPLCTRLADAEAVFDGRKIGDEADAFRQHAASCAVCAAERDSLHALAERLRASEPRWDARARQQTRARTLASASSSLLRRRLPGGAIAMAIGIGAAAATLLAFNGFAAPPAEKAAPTELLITSVPGTVWGRESDATREHLHLRTGELAIAVHRPPNAKKLVVHVPDGEVCDLGTTFHVSVTGGRTTEIVVDEGSVFFRRVGLPTLVLGPGERWSAEKAEPSARPPASAVGEPTGDEPTREAVDSPKAPVHKPPVSAAASSPSAARGDDSASAEDRLYLEILAQERSGDHAGAVALARTYLEKFPAGFRQREVARIASGR